MFTGNMSVLVWLQTIYTTTLVNMKLTVRDLGAILVLKVLVIAESRVF
jgi:hypothetical protein